MTATSRRLGAAFLLLALATPALAANVPDPRLTPGAVLSADPAKVCTPNYSRTVRKTTVAMKRETFRRYGLKYDLKAFKVDHRLPLALGGTDTQANLWPSNRSRALRDSSWRKDALETRLVNLACRRRTMTLREAQAAFLGDWRAAYRRFWGPL
jgi:hypothetical protein